jgi:predicted Fe-Mo cluster-binding NifX family protein
MGPKAQELFAAAGVKVVTGAPTETPEVLVKQYLDQTMVTGDNVCGHDPESPCNH